MADQKVLEEDVEKFTIDYLENGAANNVFVTNLKQYYDVQQVVIRVLSQKITALKSNFEHFLSLMEYLMPQDMKKDFLWEVEKTKKKKSNPRNKLTKIWLEFYNHDLPDTIILDSLRLLGNKRLINRLSDAKLLKNHIVSIFNSDEIPLHYSVIASRCLLLLIQRHGVNFENIYLRLYQILQPDLFIVNTTGFDLESISMFLDDLDIYLSSLILPPHTLAAFLKRLSELSVICSVEFVPSIITLIIRCLRRSDKCRAMVNALDDKMTSEELTYSDFFTQIDALKKSLWEVMSLSYHPWKRVRECVRRLSLPLSICIEKDDNKSDLIEESFVQIVKRDLEELNGIQTSTLYSIQGIKNSNYDLTTASLSGWDM